MCEGPYDRWKYKCPKCGNNNTEGNYLYRRRDPPCPSCSYVADSVFGSCMPMVVTIAGKKRSFCISEFVCDCGHSTWGRARVLARCSKCKTEYDYALTPYRGRCKRKLGSILAAQQMLRGFGNLDGEET